jgi:hypothetical protein
MNHHNYILLLFMAMPFFLLGQEADKYAVLLQSGKIYPKENLKQFNKDNKDLKNSCFNGKRYMLIQFDNIPDAETREKLALLDIELKDYIPNLTYTAVFPDCIDFVGFKKLPVRSVFQLTTIQKMRTGLEKGIFPEWAVKEKGFVDLNVITHEKLELGLLMHNFKELGITVLENLANFRTITLRIPQENIAKLAELPFVQWIEPISPPDSIEINSEY